MFVSCRQFTNLLAPGRRCSRCCPSQGNLPNDLAFVATRSHVAEKMNHEPNIYGADGDTRKGAAGIQVRTRVREAAIMYLTPRSRATNQNESQHISSVPDQTSL
jgi:hypothetical protein